MELARRAGVLAPLVAIVIAGTVGLARPGPLQASDPPWDPPACPPGHPATGLGTPWYTLEPTLDAEGWLTGQRLAIGDAAGGTMRLLDLPPESFVSGPAGGWVLVGDDDGHRSRLRLVDPGAGCAIEIGRRTASVVRSAVAASDGRTVFEHRVDRLTRSDQGVWRLATAGGEGVRVLPRPQPDARYGVTFSTELTLASDGRLAAASCGEDRCRTRVLDPRTGRIAEIDDTGPLLSIADHRVIAFGACPGLPCTVESIDLRTGHREPIVAGVGPAAISLDGRALVHERPDGRLELIDLDTVRRSILSPDAGGWPIRGGSAASAGSALRADEVLLAPASSAPDHAGGLRIVDTTDGSVRRLREPRP